MCTAMKIKKILLDMLLYWLQIAVYIWPSFLIGNGIVGMIVRLLVNNANNFAARISETLACIVVLCGLLFLFAYKRGYKRGEAHPIGLLISLLLAGGMQLAYASIFRYAEYTTAGAYYLAQMLHAGDHQELTFAYYDVPEQTYIIAMCIVFCFYIIAVIGGEMLGQKKRQQERVVLRKNEETQNMSM